MTGRGYTQRKKDQSAAADLASKQGYVLAVDGRDEETTIVECLPRIWQIKGSISGVKRAR